MNEKEKVLFECIGYFEHEKYKLEKILSDTKENQDFLQNYDKKIKILLDILKMI